MTSSNCSKMMSSTLITQHHTNPATCYNNGHKSYQRRDKVLIGSRPRKNRRFLSHQQGRWLEGDRKEDFYFILSWSLPLFQGVSHDLSCISYHPPSCPSLVGHTPLLSWPYSINISAVHCKLTIQDWLLT